MRAARYLAVAVAALGMAWAPGQRAEAVEWEVVASIWVTEHPRPDPDPGYVKARGMHSVRILQGDALDVVVFMQVENGWIEKEGIPLGSCHTRLVNVGSKGPFQVSCSVALREDPCDPGIWTGGTQGFLIDDVFADTRWAWAPFINIQCLCT